MKRIRCAVAAAACAAGLTIAGGALAPTAAQEAATNDDTAAANAADAPDFSLLNDTTLDLAPHGGAVTPPSARSSSSAVGSRNERADGSVAVSAGERLPTVWDAKVGLDLGLAATPLVPSALPAAQDHGAGWANVAVPAAPLGFDKATIDARLDQASDQGRLATALTRAVPVGGGMSVTLQNGYAVTQSLANPTGLAAAPPAGHIFTGDGAVRLEFPSATAVSAGARVSSSDDRLLPSLSAEQKLFDTPLRITGTIKQRPTGETERSITAGFKRAW